MKEKLGLIIKYKIKIAIALVMILSIVAIFAITKLPGSSKSIEQYTETVQTAEETTLPAGYTGIYNITDLSNIRNDLSGNYILMNDIDASSIANFTPIGTDETTPFTGVLDGNGYKVSNLNIESAAGYVGLFGYINGGTVKNLEIENEKVKGTGTLNNMCIGGLVGYANSATIEGVRITGASKIEDIHTSSAHIGGLVGREKGVRITQSSTNTQITITKNGESTTVIVGGLVGQASYNNTIEKSYAIVDINTETGGDIGGLVGWMWGGGTITESYVIGSIKISGFETKTGGIGGHIGIYGNTDIVVIKNAYTRVEITGNGNNESDTGGIVGYSYRNSVKIATITNTYAIGEIGVANGYKGGILGCRSNLNGATVTNSYWAPEIVGVSSSYGGEARTIAQMKKQANYVGWDFDTVWGIDEDKGLPYLLNNREAEIVIEDGTAEHPYLIRTVEDLQNIRNNLSAHYKVVNDIDASSIANFIPIGTATAPFTGVLDGNGHKISNINIESASQYVGLFGYINGGTVKNLELENETIKGKGTDSNNIGGLAGYANSATIEGVKITGTSKIEDRNTSPYTTSSHSFISRIGGLVGFTEGGRITHSSTNIQITKEKHANTLENSEVGGLVGLAHDNTTIEKSYAIVDINVKTGGYTGGIVGRMPGGNTITESYAIGSIKIDGTYRQYTGGIVGEVYRYKTTAKITNVYTVVNITANEKVNVTSHIGGIVGSADYNNENILTITNAYATGRIGMTSSFPKGGIVGYGRGATVTNSYWAPETVGVSSSVGGEARTIAQMKKQANYVGWNFDTIWGIDEDKGLPYLLNNRYNSNTDISGVININIIQQSGGHKVIGGTYEIVQPEGKGTLTGTIKESGLTLRGERLPKGTYTYTLNQTEAPEGYASIAQTEIQVTYDEYGNMESASSNNEKVQVRVVNGTRLEITTNLDANEDVNTKEINVQIHHINEETNAPVEGINYKVLVGSANMGEIVSKQATNSEGKINIENIGVNGLIYIVYEQENKDQKQIILNWNEETSSYEIDKNRTTIGVNARVEGNTIIIEETTAKLKDQNKLEIYVHDGINGLENAQFCLTDNEGQKQILTTNEEGIAQTTDIYVDEAGTYEYTIEQISTNYGYDVISAPIKVNITFDENGNIAKVEKISGSGEASYKEERTEENLFHIANIDITQNRNTGYSAYSVILNKKDQETKEVLAGVTYKIKQEVKIGESKNIKTAKVVTNEKGQITLDVQIGEEITLTIQEIKTLSNYVLDDTKQTIKIINESGELKITPETEGISIDNTSKTITIEKTNLKKTSNLNLNKSNLSFYITKVGPNGELLKNVGMQLRESGTGTKWILQTDENGLARIPENLLNDLITDIPEMKIGNSGRYEFWIEEINAPEGYENISEKIGFEIYYEVDPSGNLRVNTMNVLDGASYTYILDQKYDQHETDKWLQVDVILKVLNKPSEILVTPENTTSIQIEKTDKANSNIKLANAEFDIMVEYPSGAQGKYHLKTDKNGNITTPRIYFPEGLSKIKIKETRAPAGYEIDTRIKEINVRKTGTNLSVESTNNIQASNITISNGKIAIQLTNARQNITRPYSIVINKQDINIDYLKLKGAEFKVEISNEYGTRTYTNVETNKLSNAILSNLTQTGAITINITETKAPYGYELDTTTKTIGLIRDENTGAIRLDTSKLNGIDMQDISIYSNTLNVVIKNTPITHIAGGGTETPGGEGGGGTYVPTPYLYIEKVNKYNYKSKINGVRFRITKPDGTTKEVITRNMGNASISLSEAQNGRYTIEEIYAPLGYKTMEKIELDVTFEDGLIKTASIINGEQSIYKSYISYGRIYIVMQNEPIGYSGTGSGGSGGTGGSGGGIWIPGTEPEPDKEYPAGGSQGTAPKEEIKGGTSGGFKPSDPESDPSYTGESEPTYSVQIEKTNVNNQKIKVANAQFEIEVTNVGTGSTRNEVIETDSEGFANCIGLVGFGKNIIKIKEISVPGMYVLDGTTKIITINREEDSKLISLVEGETTEGIKTKIDNINRLVRVTLTNNVSSDVSIGIVKADSEDETILLKGVKFKIIDDETGENYDVTTGKEGLAFTTMPVKEDGVHTFTIKEQETAGGYNLNTEDTKLTITYAKGKIANAEATNGEVSTLNNGYAEVTILNERKESTDNYDIELIKSDAYYTKLTFPDALIKLDITNEHGQTNITKTARTDKDGKIYVNNINGSGTIEIDITEIEPPIGRRFDLKPKKVIISKDPENGWMQLEKGSSNVDTYIDNQTKKITIRVRNYQDYGKITIGIDKVDKENKQINLLGSEFEIYEGLTKVGQIIENANGLLINSNIAIPTITAGTKTVTYTIKETKAPYGYKIATEDIKLKVTFEKANGVIAIKTAEITQGAGTVEVVGRQFVHLQITNEESEESKAKPGYGITIYKVDKNNQKIGIANVTFGINIIAESGEKYYQEATTDRYGKIYLNNIKGTGRIEVIVQELVSPASYVGDFSKKTIIFTRNEETKQIEKQSSDIEFVENNGNIELIFTNTANSNWRRWNRRANTDTNANRRRRNRRTNTNANRWRWNRRANTDTTRWRWNRRANTDTTRRRRNRRANTDTTRWRRQSRWRR